MLHQNFLLFVRVQLPLAGTAPAIVLTVVLNRPPIRSMEIGTNPFCKDPSCKNEISVGEITTLFAGDPFPSRTSLRLSSKTNVNGFPRAKDGPES